MPAGCWPVLRSRVNSSNLLNKPTMCRPPLLWLAECAEEGQWLTRAQALLSESERVRYHGMRNAQRCRQFLMGRLLLRQMLSACFDANLAYWQIQEQAQQAPVLLNPPHATIAYSISHSQRMVTCLLSETPAAGCDIEWMGRERNILDIAELYFPEQAQAVLSGLQGKAQQEAFYRMWTCHEAGLKAGLPAANCQSATWQDFSISLVIPVGARVEVALVRQADSGPVAQAVHLAWTK